MKILAHVSYLTAEGDEAILALGSTNEERRHKFIAYYKNLLIEVPNFAMYMKALENVCRDDERRRLMVNLWVALQHEREQGQSTIMGHLLGMQACNAQSLSEYVSGKPKKICACLEYLELLF